MKTIHFVFILLQHLVSMNPGWEIKSYKLCYNVNIKKHIGTHK